MSFTQRTITHTFTMPDGTAGSGSVTFQLSKRMSQPGQTILPGEVTGTLASGALSVSLAANNDPTTVPADAEWLVTFRMQGEGPLGPYAITVPASGSGDIDLYTLLPQTAVSNA